MPFHRSDSIRSYGGGVAVPDSGAIQFAGPLATGGGGGLLIKRPITPPGTRIAPVKDEAARESMNSIPPGHRFVVSGKITKRPIDGSTKRGRRSMIWKSPIYIQVKSMHFLISKDGNCTQFPSFGIRRITKETVRNPLTMIQRKSVLLLKSQTTDGATDKYEELLRTNGFEVRLVKTLVFNFKNLDTLKEKLLASNAYEGVIFSSPRCVQAVVSAVEDDFEVVGAWQAKHNFTVGEATYTEALSKLGLECEGKESGSALNLTKVIVERKSEYHKPFLFPHGNLKTDIFNLELGKEGIQVEEVLVYETIANPSISNELADVTDNLTSIPEYVVFFSPSGFQSSIEHLKKIPVDLSSVKFVAIGPVTELSIREENYEIYGVTKHPTPKDLLDVISKG
ncbi:hypothetical protein NQ315_011806 [Exocentrus adspersus]|uniref:Uroporphyrinogen-III synthase n=1 Tax=Exocentrus adspersus TaxID=1586481 RepID=A0AAV8W0F5_9CUCU|nr:hypothetical protein NQ315_011806 [Exocentrus adspersus]